MKERPILMNGTMVRAALRDEDPKTQTRRILKQAVGPSLSVDCDERGLAELSWLHGDGPGHEVHERIQRVTCPYGAAGDRLWVREAWRVGKPHDETPPRDILPPALARGQGVTVLYEAGGWRSVGPEGREEPIYPVDAPMPEWAGKARPSMFMPRAFSRILLEITGVRVERLQDISEGDAKAEGARLYAAANELSHGGWSHDEWHVHASAKESFIRLWDGLAAPRADWQSNPWVWVVEFRRLTA